MNTPSSIGSVGSLPQSPGSVPQSPSLDKYFYKNDYKDYTLENAAGDIKDNSVMSGLPSNVANTSQIHMKLNFKWESTLDQLEKWETNDYSVYTGSAGVGLLLLKKAPFDRNNLRHIRKKYLQLEQLKTKRPSFLCGDAGPLAIGAVISHRLEDKKIYDFCIKRLTQFLKFVTNPGADIANEYLYGRAGYLYALLFVNKHVNPKPFEGVIRSVIQTIIFCGEKLAKKLKIQDCCPLMYEWHDTKYLGAAHGISGIIYLLLQAQEYLTEEELNTIIRPTINFLNTLRFPTGNFPSSLGPGKSDKYVQWCHGAPGFLFMYSEAYKVFKDETYLRYALKCGDVVWWRGLLKKGYSLCHGVAGNAYCFLELFQLTKETKHLYRAIKFAQYCLDFAKEKEQHTPDRPMSLFEGISGSMYLLLDIQEPMNAKFPGFTL